MAFGMVLQRLKHYMSTHCVAGAACCCEGDFLIDDDSYKEIRDFYSQGQPKLQR